MLLIVDNEDSFTYNLVQYFRFWGEETRVVRSSALTVGQCLQLKPSRVVISPGPGNPKEAGISMELIRSCIETIPLLGVCLGHQCLAECFGGNIRRAKRPMHGMISQISHDGEGLFRGLPTPFAANRYHSLIVEESTLPKEIKITARSEEGEIMGLKHEKYPLFGVQFHPESIATPQGEKLLRNFLREKHLC